MIEKDELLNRLSSEKLVTVVFTKKDGTERSMDCTRNMYTIPSEHHPKTDAEVDASSDNIKVFDLVAQAWRSFNYSTVKEVK